MEPHWVDLEVSKDGDLRFLSHLDFLRCLERALRRSGLPLHWRAGFNPRPRLSAGDALPLGVESKAERFAFALERPVDPSEIRDRLGTQLPAGLALVAVAPGKLAAAPPDPAWRLVFADPLPPVRELEERLAAAAPLRDGRGRQWRPGALALEAEGARLTLRPGPGRGGTLRPELLARALGLEPPLRAIKLAAHGRPPKETEKEINVTHSTDQRVRSGGA